MRETYRVAAQAVEAEPDHERAFRLASELREAAGQAQVEAALLRARIALRLSDAEGLSRSALAQRLGTSKARADQLIRIAREASGRPN